MNIKFLEDSEHRSFISLEGSPAGFVLARTEAGWLAGAVDVDSVRPCGESYRGGPGKECADSVCIDEWMGCELGATAAEAVAKLRRKLRAANSE